MDARDKYFNSVSEAERQIFSFEIYGHLKQLCELYPKHIEKEDKNFFLPVMDYFSEKEKEEMLAKFFEFDRKLIHEQYKNVVRRYE